MNNLKRLIIAGVALWGRLFSKMGVVEAEVRAVDKLKLLLRQHLSKQSGSVEANEQCIVHLKPMFLNF